MIFLHLLLIVLCCFIIWRASDGFESASEYLGRNLTDGVRGATINAIGSSMPELFTTLFFLFILVDKDGFSGGIGTTAGSAVFNGLVIPAVVIFAVLLKGLVSSINVSTKVVLRDGVALILAEFVLILLLGDNFLNWQHGLILMLLYVVYTVYMLKTMGESETHSDENSDNCNDDDDEDDSDSKYSWIYNLVTLNLEPVVIKKSINTANAWILLCLAMLVIGSACLLLVKACEWLGEELHIPIYFIAVILASAATSVPDTILSIKDAQKGNYDDAVSNALGSNIFDVCFALGFPLFLFCILYGPITMSAETMVNVAELRILLLLFTVIAFGIYLLKSEMSYINAALLIIVYVLFMTYVFGKSVNADFAVSIAGYLETINVMVEALRFWK